MRHAPLSAALVALAVLAGATPSHAATCSYSPASAEVTVAASAETLIARTTAGALTVDGAACGAATVSNVDTLSIRGTRAAERVTVDLANGPLAPGKTTEGAGTSEIEVNVRLGLPDSHDPSQDRLRLAGSSRSDVYRFGGLGGTFNADADVDITQSEVEVLELAGRGGGDVLSTAGGTTTGEPYPRAWALLLGGAGSDSLTSGQAGDELYGDLDEEEGDPVGAGNDVLSGGGGHDYLVGHAGNDKLDGGRGYDMLIFGDGDDTYSGGDGEDTFESPIGDGASPDGADVISGGPGYDELFFSDRVAPLIITLDGVANDGADLSLPADGVAEEGDDIEADFELVSGGPADDLISADTPAANAHDAGHYLIGDGDFDHTGDDTLRGGDGDDELWGDGGDDKLYGGAGDDAVLAGEGADLLYGGSGDDGMHADSGADKSYGGAGDDGFSGEYAADGTDVISGGPGIDDVEIWSSANLLISLDNVANDGSDADRDGVADERDNVKADMEILETGPGDDVIDADTAAANAVDAANTFRSGGGDDVMEGGSGDDSLFGDLGDDTLTGGPGSDSLYGGDDADALFAADGFFDTLHGGSGTDTAEADASDQQTAIP